MTTHQLAGAGNAGDASRRSAFDSKAVKVVGAAAAALIALGGMSAAAAAANHAHDARPAGAAAPAGSSSFDLGVSPVAGSPGTAAIGGDVRQGAAEKSVPADGAAQTPSRASLDRQLSPAPATTAPRPAPSPAVVPHSRVPAQSGSPAGPPASSPPAAKRSGPPPTSAAPTGGGSSGGSPASTPPSANGQASGKAPMPVNQDPAQSQPPSADFYSNCFGSSYSASACDQSALSDIDNALASEGYGPLSLPSNYSSLSMAAQLIAVANAERTVRGLPAMPENSSLDGRAYQGAQAGTDPTGPSGYAWGSNLATGYPTALSADYVWMYDDGTNSPNVDCKSAGASGCWGHRHNILIQGGGQAGAAIYDSNGTVYLTQLFVVNY